MKTLYISYESFCVMVIRNDRTDHPMLSALISERIKIDYLETGQIWKAGVAHGI